MLRVQGSHKKASDLMQLEFQIVGSCHVSAENQTWVPYKSS